MALMQAIRAACESEIDNELLIAEVAKRPLLYDNTLPEYSNQTLRMRLWKEVTNICFNNQWESFSRMQKVQAAKFVQKRWRNFHTCFRRELRIQQDPKKGLMGSRRRVYIYFDQLQFLLPREKRHTYGTSSTSPCLSITDTDTRFSNFENVAKTWSDDDLEGIMQEVKDELQQQSANNTQNDMDEKLLPNPLEFNGDAAITMDKLNMDEDAHFLLSLAPKLRALPMTQRLHVQIQIMSTLQQALLATKVQK